MSETTLPRDNEDKNCFGQQMPTTPTQMISRTDWGARPSKQIDSFTGPAPYVIIHHSYIPSECHTQDECIKAMRSMQDFHQIERGWNDIGYSFAIGGDGMIYTGRGFNVIGAHAPKYNDKSVGICVIGDWRVNLPPPQMLRAAKDLIAFGVAKGYIHHDYKLLGHRQVRDTECPGERLFKEIQSWPHFTQLPTTPVPVPPPVQPILPTVQPIQPTLQPIQPAVAAAQPIAPAATGHSTTTPPTKLTTPLTHLNDTTEPTILRKSNSTDKPFATENEISSKI